MAVTDDDIHAHLVRQAATIMAVRDVLIVLAANQIKRDPAPESVVSRISSALTERVLAAEIPIELQAAIQEETDSILMTLAAQVRR